MSTEAQRIKLEAYPKVLKVSDRSITYAPEFKIKAVKDNEEGKRSYHIFVDFGFDMSVIGRKKTYQCVTRWRKTFEKYGEDGVIRSDVEKEHQHDLPQKIYLPKIN
ncbi:transposase [Salimicrobium jeotgali]|uniref:Transposase n=2 Tax=Salimicrobium jeotgali TaxID=1230341 RepID=K2HAV8_9BACI|nr:transposase [Salimicrobium jeotgali]